jgi:hypothetical protein
MGQQLCELPCPSLEARSSGDRRGLGPWRISLGAGGGDCQGVQRRGGQLLAELPRGKAGWPGKENSAHDELNFSDTLRAIGLGRNAAARWQALAHIPEAEFKADPDACRRWPSAALSMKTACILSLRAANSP